MKNKTSNQLAQKILNKSGRILSEIVSVKIPIDTQNVKTPDGVKVKKVYASVEFKKDSVQNSESKNLISDTMAILKDVVQNSESVYNSEKGKVLVEAFLMVEEHNTIKKDVLKLAEFMKKNGTLNI
jgi:hypothetical protein